MSENIEGSAYEGDEIIEYTLSTPVYIPKGTLAMYRKEFGNLLFREMPELATNKNGEIAVTDIVEVDGVMQSMVVDVTPEQGMQLVAIKANGNVIYGQGSTNKSASIISVRKLSETKYELTGFSESDRFEFEFNKSTETSLQTNRLTDATVRVVGSHIEVDGAPSYEVYSLSGRKVPASSSLTPGVYIVVANGESQKVLVK